jgi:hypothetical protein
VEFRQPGAFAACQGTFGAWTEGWPLEPKDEFIRDALDAYESAIGELGVFRFLQARIDATRPPH